MLVVGSLEAELSLATPRLFSLHGKHNGVGTILIIAEKQETGIMIQTPDLVFTRWECFTACHELKRYLHYDLIQGGGLGMQSDSEPCEADQRHEHAKVLSYHHFSFEHSFD